MFLPCILVFLRNTCESALGCRLDLAYFSVPWQKKHFSTIKQYKRTAKTEYQTRQVQWIRKTKIFLPSLSFWPLNLNPKKYERCKDFGKEWKPSKQILLSEKKEENLMFCGWQRFRFSFCLGWRGRFFCILCSRRVLFLAGSFSLFCRLCRPLPISF